MESELQLHALALQEPSNLSSVRRLLHDEPVQQALLHGRMVSQGNGNKQRRKKNGQDQSHLDCVLRLDL